MRKLEKSFLWSTSLTILACVLATFVNKTVGGEFLFLFLFYPNE